MPLNYFVNVRQQTKNQLLEFIRANPDKPLKEVLGLFSLKTGLSVSKLEVYVRELQDANCLFTKENGS